MPKIFSLILLFSIIFSTSCKKNSIANTEEPITHFSTEKEGKAYLNERLRDYAKIIAALAKNEDVKEVVASEVAKRFDGDDNVLISSLTKTLEKKSVDINTDLAASLKSKQLNTLSSGSTNNSLAVDIDKLKQLLTKPIEINGKSIYPHIYIPLADKKIEDGKFLAKEKTISNNNTTTNTVNGELEYENPIIVPYDGDESLSQDSYLGFTYTDEGELIDDIIVDEEYADNHGVWILTPNERVDDYGMIKIPQIAEPTSGSSTTLQRPDLYIENMTIK